MVDSCFLPFVLFYFYYLLEVMSLKTFIYVSFIHLLHFCCKWNFWINGYVFVLLSRHYLIVFQCGYANYNSVSSMWEFYPFITHGIIRFILSFSQFREYTGESHWDFAFFQKSITLSTFSYVYRYLNIFIHKISW